MEPASSCVAVTAFAGTAVPVQMVPCGGKVVHYARTPFADPTEKHAAYSCLKSWLLRRSSWETTELTPAANALAECQPEGHTAAATRRTPSRSRGGHWQ